MLIKTFQDFTRVENENEAVNVLLSKDETYGDISPVRLNSNGISAFVSITRGCDNMCTFALFHLLGAGKEVVILKVS